jgi:phosphoribosylanthranilate isomerase
VLRIKICGITRGEDAQLAHQAGADAIGLNFYSGSKRHVTPEQAASIVAGLPSAVLRVGVFVNASADEIRLAAKAAELDAIQLHGDEPVEFQKELRRWPVIRAFPYGPDGWKPIAAYLKQAEKLDLLPMALLLDAPHSGEYGGTGQRNNWEALGKDVWDMDMCILLAGGLDGDCVSEAVRLVRPSGVDTASGVESSPGIKDPAKVNAFVSAAQAALTALQ